MYLRNIKCYKGLMCIFIDKQRCTNLFIIKNANLSARTFIFWLLPGFG
jgi:hypothetical protein